MPRLFVILGIVSAISFGGFLIWQSREPIRKLETRIQDLETGRISTAVYAVQEIEVGALVTADALETRLLPINEMPDHLIMHASDVIGLRPIYGIEKGQLLSLFDFVKSCSLREYELVRQSNKDKPSQTSERQLKPTY
jgi:flagella basal body P-ring formation protein FlgA